MPRQHPVIAGAEFLDHLWVKKSQKVEWQMKNTHFMRWQRKPEAWRTNWRALTTEAMTRYSHGCVLLEKTFQTINYLKNEMFKISKKAEMIQNISKFFRTKLCPRHRRFHPCTPPQNSASASAFRRDGNLLHQLNTMKWRQQRKQWNLQLQTPIKREIDGNVSCRKWDEGDLNTCSSNKIGNSNNY